MSKVPTESWKPRTKALLAVVCAGRFLDSMDVSMVGVALTSIRADLCLSTSTLQWVVSAYVLGYGGFLLLGGRAADLVGLFFFQAEDGIRDDLVTGVQTCALPI